MPTHRIAPLLKTQCVNRTESPARVTYFLSRAFYGRAEYREQSKEIDDVNRMGKRGDEWIRRRAPTFRRFDLSLAQPSSVQHVGEKSGSEGNAECAAGPRGGSGGSGSGADPICGNGPKDGALVRSIE